MYRLAFRIVTLSGTFIAAAYELNFVERITIAAVKNINGYLKKTSGPLRYTVEMYAFTIVTFTYLYTYDLTSDL